MRSRQRTAGPKPRGRQGSHRRGQRVPPSPPSWPAAAWPFERPVEHQERLEHFSRLLPFLNVVEGRAKALRDLLANPPQILCLAGGRLHSQLVVIDGPRLYRRLSYSPTPHNGLPATSEGLEDYKVPHARKSF